tara:strand:- start:349 stop:795 length:447 start_codon:yes stop_codon:yes gene_type:complete
MNYKKWVEVLTNYYEVDIDNCTMSKEAWIEQIAKSLSNPMEFKLDVIEYRKVEGRDLDCKDLMTDNQLEYYKKIKENNLKINTVKQTEFTEVEFLRMILKKETQEKEKAIAKASKAMQQRVELELEKQERIKEKEYYMKIGNTSGTID